MNRFQRYRVSKRDKGMRLVRIWAPDVRAPGFIEEAARQAKLLERKPEQIEATGFITAPFAWPNERGPVD